MSRTEGLGRYGVRPPTIVREPARDSQGIPICPECGHPVPQTKQGHQVHQPDVVDRDLRERLEGALVVFGWRCDEHAYEIVTPARCDADATHMVAGWTGVELAFADGHTRYVAVPEKIVETGGEA